MPFQSLTPSFARSSIVAVTVVAAVAAFLAPTAAAQTRDPVAAEALFEAGRQAYQAGDFAGARAKFAEATRLDPTAGAFSNLAACEEKLGLTASAWQSWRAALDYVPSGEKVRRASLTAKVKALEPVLARLALRLAPGVPTEGVEVRRDGVLLGTASLGVALPVDPGAHEVIVVAPGREPRRYGFLVAASDRKTIELELGPPVAVAAVAAPEPLPYRSSEPPAATTLGARATAPVSSGPSAFGVTLLVAGTAALATAGYLGYLAHGARSDALEGCRMRGNDRLCATSARDALDRDKRYSLYTDIGIGAGALLVGTGLWLLLRDDAPETQAALEPTPGGARFTLAGRF